MNSNDRQNACPQCGMYIWAHRAESGNSTVFAVTVAVNCTLSREQSQALYDSRHPKAEA